MLNLKRDWSADGIETETFPDTNTKVRCKSSHLTSFAVLVDHRGLIENSATSEEESIAMSIVSYIGITISVVCLISTIVILIMLRHLIPIGQLLYVHINLSLALLLALLVFMTGVEFAKSIPWLCGVVAGVLHYLLLCVFCWMLAEGIMLYTLFVKVLDAKRTKFWHFIPLGWGLPVIVVTISAAVRPQQYGVPGKYCWLSSEHGTIWAFVGPMLAIISVNVVLLLMTLYSLVRNRKQTSFGAKEESSVKELVTFTLKATAILLTLLGCTWIIGIFAVSSDTTVFLWIFIILNSLQGVSIFLLHVLRYRSVRRYLIDKVTENLKFLELNFSVFKKIPPEGEVVDSHCTSGTQMSLDLNHGNSDKIGSTSPPMRAMTPRQQDA